MKNMQPKTMHKNQKGIIHTTSYKQLNFIKETISETNSRRLLVVLRSKQCPNCNESNNRESKFCAKCRMVLTYDAYNETLEGQKQKEGELDDIKRRFSSMEGMLEKLVAGLSKTTDQQQFNAMAQSLFSSGVLTSTVEDRA